MQDNMKNTLGSIMVILGGTLIVLCLIGYIKNIVHLVHCDFKAPYKAEVIYMVGTVTPIGVITGWINIAD